MKKKKYIFLLNQSINRNPRTNVNLCFYNPSQTLKALKNNKIICNWHSYILKNYRPKKSKILLIFPCAANKPWTEGKTKSRNYQILYQLLKDNNLRKSVSLHTISEPLGIVGEEDYEMMPIYDNPGLFRWFAKKNKLEWDQQKFEVCINILGNLIGKFLRKHEKSFKKIIAFLKPSSPHKMMISRATKYLESGLFIGPTQKELGNLKNPFIWMDNANVKNLFLHYLK